MKIRLMVALILLCLLAGCEWMEDLRNMEPLEVLSVDPSEDLVDAGSLNAVSLEFSSEMNTVLTEESFSLKEDDTTMEGVFEWEGRTLRFVPYEGFKENREYLITLRKKAEDEYGNSLPEERYWLFRTGEDTTPPEIVSVNPPTGSRIATDRQQVVIRFSETVNQQSFRDGFSVSPSLTGEQVWADDGLSVTFNPLNDYAPGEDYTFTISTELTDHAGNGMVSDTVVSYQVEEKPEASLVSLTRTGGIALVPESQGINENGEKDDVLSCTFSRALDEGERSAFFTIKPSVSYEVDWDTTGTACDIRFTDNLQWDTYYDVIFSDETYIFRINGSESEPLEVVRAAFCLDRTAGPPVISVLNLNDSINASDSTTAFLDFTLRGPLTGTIDLLSFINALSIDSSVLTFDFRQVEICDGSQVPAPSPAAGAGETILRVHTEITDSLLPGTVTFSLGDSLSDSLGNTLEEEWILTVSQP